LDETLNSTIARRITSRKSPESKKSFARLADFIEYRGQHFISFSIQRTQVMKPRTLAAIMFAVFGWLGMAQAADGPAGAWKIRPAGARADRTTILRLQLDGDKLTGSIIEHLGTQTKIDNASFQDGRISFEVTRQLNGQRLTTKYTGTLAGDTIRGTVDSQGGRGTFPNANWEATRTIPEELSIVAGPALAAADIGLNDDNYKTWRDHILPDADEMAWEQIPWLTTFKDGILASDQAGKPLLLWTMNGHPLGCT
jgi:hypothetical protein